MRCHFVVELLREEAGALMGGLREAEGTRRARQAASGGNAEGKARDENVVLTDCESVADAEREMEDEALCVREAEGGWGARGARGHAARGVRAALEGKAVAQGTPYVVLTYFFTLRVAFTALWSLFRTLGGDGVG